MKTKNIHRIFYSLTIIIILCFGAYNYKLRKENKHYYKEIEQLQLKRLRLQDSLEECNKVLEKFQSSTNVKVTELQKQ